MTDETRDNADVDDDTGLWDLTTLPSQEDGTNYPRNETAASTKTFPDGSQLPAHVRIESDGRIRYH